jgi:hypothetical protein
MRSTQCSKTIAAIWISASLLAPADADAGPGCMPIGRNRSIDRVTIENAASGQSYLRVDVAVAVSGTTVPNMDSELVVMLNGRTVSRTAVNFALPASAGACDFVEGTLYCAGTCGTSGLFSCKGLVISGGMYCGCSVLKAPEIGPYSPIPGDRLSLAVLPASGAASEIYPQDDRQEIVIVRSTAGAPAPGDPDRFTAQITFDNTLEAGNIDADTVRLNGTLAASSVEPLRTGLAFSFSRAAMQALGVASSVTISGRFKDGTRFWGAVDQR